MTRPEPLARTPASLDGRRLFALLAILACLAAPAVASGGLGHVAADAGGSAPALADATTAKATGVGNATAAEEATAGTRGDAPADRNHTWINGTIATSDGAPAAGDTVQLWHDGNLVAETTTGAQGAFAARVPADRTYTLVYRQATAQTASSGGAEGATVETDDGIPDVAVVTRADATGEETAVAETLPAAETARVQVRPTEDGLLANASLAMRVLPEEANRTETNATVNRARMAALTGNPGANGTAAFERYGRGVELRPSATVAITGRSPGDEFENATRTAAVANGSTVSFHFREVDREPPVVRAETLRDAVNVSRPVTLTARNSTDDTAIRSVRWRFADGTTLTGDTVTRSYATKGTKSVTVTVTDRDGKRNETTLEVSVEDRIPPGPALSINASTVAAGVPVTFNASGATDNHRIETYRWDVTGDRTYDRNTTTPTYAHTYEDTGPKRVRVTVVDASGNEATLARNVTVRSEPPAASIGVNRSRIAIGEPVAFRAANANGSNATYEWAFSDGINTTGESVVRSFPDSGSYTATLTVTDGNGASATATRTVRVKNHAPVAVVQAPSTVDEGETVTLDARNSSDLDQDGLQYAWTQTEGPNVSLSRSDAARPTFTAPNVTEPTTLEFTMTAMDEHGRTDSARVSVEVRPVLEPPPAVFGYLPQQPRVNETASFEAYNTTNVERDAISGFAWDFDGDGTVDARNETVTHRFAESGRHVVTLTVVGARNETVTTTRTVSVVDPLRVTLPAPRNVTADTVVPLTAATPDAVATPATYEWDVSTSNASALPSGWSAADLLTQTTTEDPRVALRTPDVRGPLPVTVSVRVTDARGATATANASFTVRPPSPPATTAPTSTTTTAPPVPTTTTPPADTATPPTGTAPTADSGDDAPTVEGQGGPSGDTGQGVGGQSNGPADSPSTTAPPAPNVDPPSANGPPTVDVRTGTNGRATAAVRNVSPGDAVEIALPSEGEERPTSAFDSIDLVTDESSSGPAEFELRTQRRQTAPDDVPAPPDDTAFSYLSVHKDGITNAQIDSATFTFRVATETLDERGLSPEDVTLHRYHDGEWSALDTAVSAQDSKTVTFRATTPGFSTFAIGASDGDDGDEGEGDTGNEQPTEDSTSTATTPEETTAPTDDGENDQRSGIPNGPQDDMDFIYLLALAVAVIGAVLWGYLL